MVNEGIITSPPPKTNLLEESSLKSSCEWFIEATEEDASILMTKLTPSLTSVKVVKVFFYACLIIAIYSIYYCLNSNIFHLLLSLIPMHLYLKYRCTRGGIVQQMLVIRHPATYLLQATLKMCFIQPETRFESLSNPTSHQLTRQISGM